jgi:hypothetical protein
MYCVAAKPVPRMVCTKTPLSAEAAHYKGFHICVSLSDGFSTRESWLYKCVVDDWVNPVVTGCTVWVALSNINQI